MADLVDPTAATGKYPVILSDSLLSGSRDEIFTGLRYNHKPTLADGAPEHARLKPSVPGDTSSYDMSFIHNGGHYAFAGTRNFAKDQYVLYFDPNRQAFILDRVESTFDMNLTRIPGNSDPASLARKYPHLEKEKKPTKAAGLSKKQSDAAGNEPAARKPPVKSHDKSPLLNSQPRRGAAKKQEPQPKRVDLALPAPEAPKPKSKPKTKPKPPPARKPVEDDEEDEDDDGGLLIEYPDADRRAAPRTFSPAFPQVRRFDDFMDRRESEADDGDDGDEADGESGEDEYEDINLPSPVNQQRATAQQCHDDEAARQQRRQREPTPMEVDDDEDDGYNNNQGKGGQDQGDGEEIDDFAADLEKDMEEAFDLEKDDFEKDMEMAFEEVNNGQDAGDESEISEED